MIESTFVKLPSQANPLKVKNSNVKSTLLKKEGKSKNLKPDLNENDISQVIENKLEKSICSKKTSKAKNIVSNYNLNKNMICENIGSGSMIAALRNNNISNNAKIKINTDLKMSKLASGKL